MTTSSSSVPFFGIGEEDQIQMKQQQHSSSTPTSSSGPPLKKKRNLPGTPNPDAEVIALSPKTLMATNRFICEVCNKGFQREQNLQLHRRGHNLPWKLKQKTTKEVKRKVYLCPEPTCVHHDPSRALGDLTGIKKHYSRKHGEKKWKCDKCSKRYAVQSDWKAHSKTCGTREYRCDCGTLFSRRDSFITHRAFCDALAQETARHPTTLNSIGSHLYGAGNNANMGLGLSQVGPQFPSSIQQEQTNPSSDMLRLISPSNIPSSSFRPPQSLPSSAFFVNPDQTNPSQDFNEENQTPHGLLSSKPYHGLLQLPDLQTNTNNPPSATNNLFNLSFFSNNTSSIRNNNNANFEGSNLISGNVIGEQITSGIPSLYSTSVVQNDNIAPHMSATALLQKAAQMGSTTSNHNASLLRGFGSSSSSGIKQNYGGIYGTENENHLQDLMNIFGGVNSYGGNEQESSSYGGFNANNKRSLEQKIPQNLSGSIGGGSDRLTRDFLGVGEIVRTTMSGGGYSQGEQRQHGNINISSFESEANTAPTSQSFGSRNFQ